MTHTYQITGMTCQSCVAKVKTAFLSLGDVTSAQVQLDAPQATLDMQKHIPLTQLQAALSRAGRYTIVETTSHNQHTTEDNRPWFAIYKPVLLILLYLTLVTAIVSFQDNAWNGLLAMRVFMSGFFLVFSFFKLLDLRGFSDSYAMYDVIAKKWHAWGYIYPFVELTLGILFATNIQPLFTNVLAFVVMLISLMGVLQSVLNKQKIKCACLGAVFNLPMSTITIVEDTLMIAMSGAMLAMMW